MSVDEPSAADTRAGSSGGVAPDGSPVAVYRRLPIDGLLPVVDDLTPEVSVLDLGCGVGRLSNHLAAAGWRCVGVDESEEMLVHLVPDVEGVCARIQGLDLGRRFGAVVLASHFVNVADVALRRELLETVRRHLDPDGAAYIEHYDPDGFGAWDGTRRRTGEVEIGATLRSRDGDVFRARVQYWVDDETWWQDFEGRVLDDDGLRRALGEAGLRPGRRLTPHWITAVQPR